MDPQLKRGLLDICVLSAISREDSYGYKIIKDLADVIEISESTLYPILRRLEGAGSLRSYSVEHNGRLRKFYSITPKGKKMIIEFLESWQQVEEIHRYILEGEDDKAKLS
ncbi:MAG: PadR family transcriptional regulator [Tissierellia bacterium]|nr:PadR family transcriptional regulator [Bacillota bacterium]NLL22603.1 PadR family transcriptional regulator [Tissierellia bacterium]